MFFAYSWIGEFTFKGLLTKSGREEGRKKDKNVPIPYFKSRKLSIIIGLMSIVAALFVGYYNFAASKLSEKNLLMLTFPHYVRWLKEMLNSTCIVKAISYASHNNRFLYLTFHDLCFLVEGSSLDVFVAYCMSVFLTFLLMFATFFLVMAGRSIFMELQLYL